MSLTTTQNTLVDKLVADLETVTTEADYDEIYGYQLDPNGAFYDAAVLRTIALKFLKANDWDYNLAKTQLTSTLKWRKKFNPLSAGFREEHDKKFDVISYITWYPENPANEKVVTFNVYGNVTDPAFIFGDLDAFLRWRVGIMEKGIQLLDMKDTLNDYMVQLHDYKKLSFFRLDAHVKRGSKATIKLFQDYYPEVLSEKFFINIPFILSWVFNFVAKFVSEATRKKFKVCDGMDVAKYLGDQVPKEYGGKSSKTLEEQRFEFNSEQNVQFKLPPYAAHLLSKQFTLELD